MATLPRAGTAATAAAWHEKPHTVVEHYVSQMYWTLWSTNQLAFNQGDCNTSVSHEHGRVPDARQLHAFYTHKT